MLKVTPKTRKTEVLSTILGATNVYDALVKMSTNPTGKQNMVRVADYSAEDKGGAGKRFFDGKSGRGKGQNVGRQIIGKHTGLAWNKKGNRSTMFIGYKDLSSSKSGKAGDYDFRTMIVSDILNPEATVESVEVCEYFGSWQKIRPADYPTMWPVLPKNMQEDFVLALMDCLTMGAIIDLLDNKIAYIKKALKKDDIESVTAKDGSSYCYIAPKGTSKKIYNASDKTPVTMVIREVDLIRLNVMVHPPLIGVIYPQWTEVATKGKVKGTAVFKSDADLLPLYVAELKRLKNEYEQSYSSVRPYEMGLIEKALAENGELPEFVSVNDTVLEIEHNTTKRYELPSDTKAKLESGEYIEIEEPSSKGKWELIPASNPTMA